MSQITNETISQCTEAYLSGCQDAIADNCFNNMPTGPLSHKSFSKEDKEILDASLHGIRTAMRQGLHFGFQHGHDCTDDHSPSF